MKTLIIEDEVPAANRLVKTLGEIDPDITILNICKSVGSAVKWLNSNPNPDLIIMDIELMDGSSFEIFEQVQVNSPVIFVTAYNEFAIKAIKFNAMDYLLKPIKKDELTNAINKVKKNNADKTPATTPDFQTLQQFISNFSIDKAPKRIAIRNLNDTTFVDIDKIIRFEADSNYTNIFLTDGKKIMASRPLIEYQELLSPYGFFRIHKGYLINVSQVEKYIKGDGGYVVMKDGATIEVSRNKRKDLLLVLSLN